MAEDSTSRPTPGVHHLRVSRSARYHTLGAEASEAAQVWIALHGYAMLADRFLRLVAPLAEGGRTLVVAPEALSRFYLETGRDGRHSDAVGATWLTREDRENEIADALRYLDQLHGELAARVPPDATIAVLGFSQGATMAARWVATGSVIPDQLVLWGIVPPADSMAQVAERMTGREVALIAGDRDPFAGEGTLEAQAATLARLGVRARAERFHGGHALSKAVLRRLGDVSGPA
jgi:predicted esterase